MVAWWGPLRRLGRGWPKERRLAVLGAAWLMAMIALPIADWLGGAPARAPVVTVAIGMQAVWVAALLKRAWGGARLLRVALLVIALGWGAEALGTRLGLPFGDYRYTGGLRPEVGGVPVAVALAWWAMLPPSWAVVESALGRPLAGRAKAPWARPELWLASALAGLAMTAWDLYLDPQMVGWGYWQWSEAGPYFGIPAQNFLGWWLVASTMTMVVAPRSLGYATAPLALTYTLTWLLEAGGVGLLWGMPRPALCGLLGMGAFVFAAWRRPSTVRSSEEPG